MLLDQLDLHRARLRHADLDGHGCSLTPHHGFLLDHGQDVERTDAMHDRPLPSSTDEVVDDEPELEEAVLTLGPLLFVERVVSVVHRAVGTGRTKTSCMTLATRRPALS